VSGGGSKLVPLLAAELRGALCTNPVLFTETAIGTEVCLADIAQSHVPLPIGSLLPQKKYFAEKRSGYHTEVVCIQVCTGSFI
jgi:hypothetical protein